jgi:PBP1b-binding outer membrane lipoprotein LpoB
MKSLAIILLAFVLTSCVNIPIPPSGQNQGKLGSVQLKLSVSYIPYIDPDRPVESKPKQDPSVMYAWEHFSKTLKDK